MVGDVGLAQPSLDYDVDSNPERWPERLRVKGLGGLWPGLRPGGNSQLWSLNDGHVLAYFYLFILKIIHVGHGDKGVYYCIYYCFAWNLIVWSINLTGLISLPEVEAVSLILFGPIKDVQVSKESAIMRIYLIYYNCQMIHTNHSPMVSICAALLEMLNQFRNNECETNAQACF